MSLIWAKTRNFNVLRKLTLEQKYMETMHSSLQGEAGVKAGGWTWRIGANHRSGIRLFIIRLTIMKKYTPSSNPILWVVLHVCPCPLKKMMIPIIQLYHIISYPNCNTFFSMRLSLPVFRIFATCVCVCVCPMGVLRSLLASGMLSSIFEAWLGEWQQIDRWNMRVSTN